MAAARRSTTDPVDAILRIGDVFMQKAETLDHRAEDSIADGADRTDISALADLADAHRMRALACFQAAAPFRQPRLQAIEVKPPEPMTVERFRERVGHMSEDEILERIRKVERGATALKLIEADDPDEEI
jgi:hypothetical protein